MTNYDCAVYLNNLAVGFLRQGNHASAGRSLLTALCQLPHVDIEVGSPWPSRGVGLDSKHSSNFQASHDGRELVIQKCTNWVEVIEPDHDVGIGTQAGPSMYSFALTLSRDVDNQQAGNTVSWQSARAAVLYNLALLYHWRAMHMPASSGLSQALRFYQEAAETLQHHSGEVQECGQGHLALAVLNNMGHIHFQLLQYDQARQCFRCLRSHLSLRVGSISRLQSMEDFEVFVMSAMLPFTEMQLAPAA